MVNAGYFEKIGLLDGIFDVGFERHQSIFARLVQQVIHHFQRFQISFLVELASAEYPAESGRDLFQNVQWVGHQNGADRRAANDDEFRRLHQHLEIAVLHQVASSYGAEYDKNSNDRKHFRLSLIPGSGESHTSESRFRQAPDRASNNKILRDKRT